MSLAAYTKLLRSAFGPGGPGYGLHQNFRVVSMKATREAMDIVHDTWFAALQRTNIANRVPGFGASLAYNAITRTFAERSQGMPMAIERVPQFWVEESVSWKDGAGTPEIDKFLVDVNKEVEGQLVQKRLALDYLYLNDAEKGQKVFEGYGKRNVQKMKEIRRKYDPKNVFTELMPGGFKVRDVEL
jgi:hypothetical protein